MRSRVPSFLSFCLAVATALSVGCASSSESASRQSLTANVGNYGPAPTGVERPRVGVPGFKTTGKGSSAALDDIAADQLTTLVVNSNRFSVIERASLSQLLDEQNLGGVVKEGELARTGEIRGVDYLLLGKVTDLRVQAEKSGSSFGFARIPIIGTDNSLGAFDFKKKDSTIKATCGVDLRLVDPSSGEIWLARSSTFERVNTIGAFGVQVLGVNADADASLQLTEDNKGAILRLALDDTLKQLMPDIDARLRQQHPAATATNVPTSAPTDDSGAPEK